MNLRSMFVGVHSVDRRCGAVSVAEHIFIMRMSIGVQI
jgi:hypothetical protein